ncbi:MULTISPECIES: hypothetical protein [unclassified Variovorax]|uniref:hypothetical protein n=1 Tax=unclassified Variovorax TaxID=663243 RepID=UPI001BD2A135|nr:MULTISPECIES: hypothetical protein [unclassified Variovorax]
MRPKVEIEKIRESYFNYSVSTEGGNAIYARDGLYSIAECIHDAATALGHNFPFTTLGYEGFVLGEFSVAMMEHSAKMLERWLEALLIGLASNGPLGDDCLWQPSK